ncbi:MAG: patatin [Gammaproteobacteria bacterium]|nr:MAG: patatin [Gammaproteobacteria bacterium]
MALKILSIDGGGIRGIIPGQILVALENKIRKRPGHESGKIGDYFDLFAGTSTGAILSAAYVCPGYNQTLKYSAQDAVNFYLEDGDEIFDVGFWKAVGSVGGLSDEKYPAAELERVLKDAFGDVKLSELAKPTCIVAYDVKKRVPVIFTQHDAIDKEKDFLVRDLLRGSTAAPTYFETAKIYSLPPARRKYVLIDGGMVANDPTLCAYSEAIEAKMAKGIKDMMILSLGTGKELRSYSYPEVKDWGKLGWATAVIDIGLEGGPQMTEYHMKSIASTVRGSQFYRIQPKLYGADKGLDVATPENLEALRDAGIRNAEDYDAMLEGLADYLTDD